MRYRWKFDKKAEKQFEKLDKPVQRRLYNWLELNISGTNNPRLFGKALEGEFKTLWRYRVGKYRIIADIVDDEFVVVVLKTDKRSDVYRNK
ncbi:type II toxin-antitoxin system RelE family toxin [Fructobacillus tropaeoli]|uniref:Toxin component of the RelBE toxin-antitoxin system (RelE) n=1 Tax=Fructobacillus tropaeoli TaxID=709323 RepID=A0A3F3H464_9LACO|nr:type II toxin-antitoxin system RelE/ParE family toxin [Fructobacillus tropaeoli]GAP04637.1 toxin-antitoxin system, toxin component, RelE family [Fructobacillus tropaeoli]GIC70559.1 type II toxin-antitoxin system RelE/ParE family toxin [Fructobacillus tropaeoli]CAK1240849.1 mRNA-degrading endonuclease RelE [Fructobacillus tropaeoli]CAK1247311.1 mRNA-degrading endonuclease RelE [Fructobacillus tropaeoli]